MYSIKVEMIRQNINKKNTIDLTEIKRVFETNYLELEGEFLFNELPFLDDSDVFTRKSLEDERGIYESILKELDKKKFSSYDRVSDCNLNSYVNNKMFNFTDYHFGTTNIKINIVKPLFIYKCKHVIDRLNYDLSIDKAYEVKRPNHLNFIELTKKIRKDASIKEGLFSIMLNLCDSEQRSFVLWLNNLIAFNKLYKYYENDCDFMTYFNSDVSRIDFTLKKTKH